MAITNQKLEWILTQHGKNRITELLNNPDKKIRITRLGIGSDNEGTPKQRENNGTLNDPIKVDGTELLIPINDKGLDTERENTVYFKAFIGEDMSGFEIAELALYEEIDGVEYMFAVGVGQPIAKPKLSDGYVYAIEYTLYIESTNLLEVYDQIELDPANEYLKETDMNTLYRTVLFVEGNLVEQIGNNTHIIGLDRAQQLDELISDVQLHYNSNAIANYYATLGASVTDLSNILGFWSFHYISNFGVSRNIRDFSVNRNYWNTNNVIANYALKYENLMSSLNFKDNDYFYLNPIKGAISMSVDVELGRIIDHTLIDDLTYSTSKNGWLCTAGTLTEAEVKSNIVLYYLKADYAVIEDVIISHQVVPNTIELVTVEEEGQQVPDFGEYAFGPHTWEYDSDTQSWTCYDIATTYDEGTFKNRIVNYRNIEGHEDEQPLNGTKITLTVGLGKTPEDGATISLTGSRFDLLTYNASNTAFDSPFTFIASLKHNTTGERNTLLAQSDYFTAKHNFEIVKNENDAIEMTLFSGVGDKYIKFVTQDHAVSDKLYNLVITYNPNYNAYNMPNPIVRVYINNIYFEVEKIESYRVLEDTSKQYRGMIENNMETGCYVRAQGSNERINTINAEVSLMALIKEEFNATVSRCNSLMLNSMTGKTVYYRV